jgi:superoxide dismutase, Fe-Mn family
LQAEYLFLRSTCTNTGTNASAYVAAFMPNIDWSAVEGRYEDAITTKPPPHSVQRQFGDLPSMTMNEVKMMLDQVVRQNHT